MHTAPSVHKESKGGILPKRNRGRGHLLPIQAAKRLATELSFRLRDYV